MAFFVRPVCTLVAVLVVATALVPWALAGSRADVLPTLYVEYGMGCNFTISDDNGRRVTSIAPGQYQIHVHTVVVFAVVDLSGISDLTACKGNVQFQLAGPGVDLFTTLQDGDEDRNHDDDPS